VADRFSKTAIDRLGRKLAETTSPDAADTELLLAYLRQASSALDHTLMVVARVVSSLPAGAHVLHVTHRVKTIGTIIEKLRRGTGRLSQMQDVVGVRVVGSLGLAPRTSCRRSLQTASRARTWTIAENDPATDTVPCT